MGLVILAAAFVLVAFAGACFAIAFRERPPKTGVATFTRQGIAPKSRHEVMQRATGQLLTASGIEI